jgi:hydroxymethylpyrimidine/phosphomethylpyrimidine kinase
MSTLPVVATIAGSDNSAGAGIQADLKTMSALGVYGVTALTCVVAEVPGKVCAIQAVEPQIVAAQVRLLFEAFPVAALKTGMLHSRVTLETVCAELEREFKAMESAGGRPPLVVDPVMVATSGHALLETDAVAVYRERLFGMASLVTPNLDEVAALIGRPVTTCAAMREAGEELVARFGVPFLIKGGHLRGQVALDLLFAGGRVEEFRAPFVPGVSTHGTGCTYSAAIASELGKGRTLSESVAAAKRYVSTAIEGYLQWEKHGRATDALHHFAGRI